MDPSEIISTLGLVKHPEGGYYSEVWRAGAGEAERAAGTSIYFLLEAGQRSHWHRVDATELWFWHAGSALELRTAAQDQGPVEDVVLGPDVIGGQRAQHRIEPHHWQAAYARDGWALVSCVVVPGFEFDGFVLAPPEFEPG